MQIHCCVGKDARKCMDFSAFASFDQKQNKIIDYYVDYHVSGDCI